MLDYKGTKFFIPTSNRCGDVVFFAPVYRLSFWCVSLGMYSSIVIIHVMNDGRLCEGDDSCYLHYWWYRRNDNDNGQPFQDENEAVRHMVNHIITSMEQDKSVLKAFNLDSADSHRAVFRDLYGRVTSMLDRLRNTNTPELVQEGHNREPVLCYKQVSMAQEANIPLFEIVILPVLTPPKPSSKVSGELEIRIYESEPKALLTIIPGHRSGLKKIVTPGSKRSRLWAQKRTQDIQNMDIRDAMQQYQAAQEQQWFSSENTNDDGINNNPDDDIVK